MVMPRSRSRSIASRTCASISRACSAPVMLEKAVGQRRLAVVDVRDDREITDERDQSARYDRQVGPASSAFGHVP